MTPDDKRQLLNQRKAGTDDAQDPAAVPEHLFSQYGLSDPDAKPPPDPLAEEAGTGPVKSRPRSRSPAAPRR